MVILRMADLILLLDYVKLRQGVLYTLSFTNSYMKKSRDVGSSERGSHIMRQPLPTQEPGNELSESCLT